MRSIMTFVFRLLVDDETPQRINGALQTVINPQTYTFQNSQELLDLLIEFSRPDAAALPPAQCVSEDLLNLKQSEGER